MPQHCYMFKGETALLKHEQGKPGLARDCSPSYLRVPRRQESGEFKVSLDNLVSACLKNKE